MSTNEPLDLGEIEPGERQEWRPGWTERYGEPRATAPVSAERTVTDAEVQRAAEQCTWANRREGVDDTLVDWPREDYEAYAIIAKALSLMGFTVTDE